MSDVNNTQARRNVNAENARMLAECGLVVFPSSGKVPLVKAFNRLDTDLTDDEREDHAAKYRQEHDGEEPPHIGATRTLSVVKMLWRKYPDAVPSIACGPSGLVVLDADAKDGGPEKLGQLLEDHGYPEGAPKVPTRDGGFHLYLKSDGTFGNRAGALKREYGTDVRGRGGQTVAPGSWREDGKRYGTREDLYAFLRAYRGGKIPEVPDYIRAKIGEASEAEASLSDSDPTIKSLIGQLGAEAWPDFSVAFDEALGGYSLQYLRDCEPGFIKLYDDPSSDRSANRFNAACYLAGAFPDLTVQDYAAFCGEWDGAGDFDARQLAREFAKAKLSPRLVYKPSDGAAFGDVSDQIEVVQPEVRTRLARRFEYIENLRGAAVRFLEWCIKFVVARGTTSVATGLWGAGKTAVFSDIGLHVGHGFEWRGRKVTKGVVIYVALENSDDVERRVSTWCELMEKAGRDVSDGAFVVHRGPCCLFDPSGKPTRDEKDLIEIASIAARHYRLDVAMIVLDTLAQSIAPGDDNSAKDAGIYTAALKRISDATGANVTALAHPTKAGDGVRGSGALQANVDTVIEVSRDKAGRGTIKAGSKYRIGDPAKVEFGYRLKSHKIGQDEDGDDINVMLAVEEMPRADLVVDDVEDDAALIAPDTPEDKLRAVLRIVEELANEGAATTGDKLGEVGVSAGRVFNALNADRRGAGLPVLKDRTMATRLLGKLAERGEIVKSGDNRRTEYRMP
jgi:hypothetical protein